MKKKNIFFLNSGEKINYYYSKNDNLLFLQKNLSYGKLRLPSFFFVLKKEKKIIFLFTMFKFMKTMLNLILSYYKKSFKFFFFRLRLRGLGYKIKKFAKKFYRFFFGINHYFYLNVPYDIVVKRRRRTLLVFSLNLQKLNDFFTHLLLVKKLDLYERANSFIVAKKILFLKKRK